jgi:hypothetical protein
MPTVIEREEFIEGQRVRAESAPCVGASIISTTMGHTIVKPKVVLQWPL